MRTAAHGYQGMRSAAGECRGMDAKQGDGKMMIATLLDGRVNRQKRKETDIEKMFRGAELLIDHVCRRNNRYRVYVHKNQAIGLYRITVTDRNDVIGQREGFEGRCVRELYTYQPTTNASKLSSIMGHVSPPEYCASLAMSWNCAEPGGPIALDATINNRMAHAPNQPPLAQVGSAS